MIIGGKQAMTRISLFLPTGVDLIEASLDIKPVAT